MVRIDERLIHGQVAVYWTKNLNVNRIAVVNDKAYNNPIQTSTLKMAAPDTAKAIVLNREKAVQLFSDPRAQKLKILIVVNNPADARFLVENIDGISYVNIGNYGKLVGDTKDKTEINDNLFVDETDKENLKAIADKGVQVEYQLVPDQAKISLKQILTKGE